MVKDDYKDDYTLTSTNWVNYLAGGSRVLHPSRTRIKYIPVDVAMALHSDAGKRRMILLSELWEYFILMEAIKLH